MRKTISLIVILIITPIILAQPNTFVFKTQMIGGLIIPTSNNLKNINHKPTIGGEFAIEFPSWNAHPWQQYLDEPTLGVGFVGLNLGNNKILGQ